MKRFVAFFILLAFALSGCSHRGIEGVYSLTIGKESGTHIGVSLELLDEVCEKKADKGYKSFDLKVLFGETPGVDESMKELLGSGVKGYYYVEASSFGEQKTRLALGITDFNDIITSLTGNALPSDFFELLLTAFIEDKKINLYVPVSVEDLQMQLCWYGIFVAYSDKGLIIERPVHPISGGAEKGTHPTAEQIKQMNEANKELFARADFVFRDYHTVDIELFRE